MSLYGMLFGQNAMADALLATLGLTRADVGRFRDCYVAEGKIVVYTRNGGGNRDCWHECSPEWGSETCRHEAYEVEENERERYVVDADHPAQSIHLIGAGPNGETMSERPTGRKVKATRYRCLEPNSEHCGCVGCFMTYRVHELPHYHHDEDDDFDCTYATIYFDFPPDFADELRALDSGEKWEPSERWMAVIEALKGHDAASALETP